MDRAEFFNEASNPGFTNEMDFILRKDPNNPGGFSADAYENIGYQIHDFIVARTLGTWKETNKPPHNLRVRLSLVWDEDDKDVTDEVLARENLPAWYALTDIPVGESVPITPDGELRFKPFLKKEE